MNNPVNILQLISSIGFFGAENMLVQLSLELTREANVNLVVGVIENLHNPHLEVAEKCREMGIEVAIFSCKGKFDLRTLVLLRRFIRERKINMIHSHGYKSNLYSLFSSRGLNVSVVSTCHNWLGDDLKMKAYAYLDRFLLKKFNKVVAVSDEVKQKILNSGVSSEKVRIIPNGIRINPFMANYPVEEIKTGLGINAGDVVVGTVGRLSVEKNHRMLLKIADAVLECHSRARFLIIGEGPLKNELQNEFRSSSIIFTGFRSDIPALYQSMDLFVLPSLTEGLPMVLLEAMASRLPVIASRVGAVEEVVVDGETGLLVEPSDETALLKSITFLLSNPNETKRMGEKGRSRVKTYFSADRMSGSYLQLYSELVEHKNGVEPFAVSKAQSLNKKE